MRQRTPYQRMRFKIGVLSFFLLGLCFLLVNFGIANSVDPPLPVDKETDTQETALQIQVPPHVKQGQTLVVSAEGPSDKLKGSVVWLAGNKVPLYEMEPGHYQALMPVSVLQKAGGYTVKVQNYHGQNLLTTKVEVTHGKYPIQNIRVSSSTKGLQPLPGELEAIGALKTMATPVRHWNLPFITPTPDCQNSPFGVIRYHNGKPSNDYHKGVDLRSPAGRPIKAINNGKVVLSKMYRLHGGTVGLDHGQGVTSVYIHMSNRTVNEGDMVKKGDVIGHVGSTGFATGPHLHWGLYINGLPVEPNQWISGVPRC